MRRLNAGKSSKDGGDFVQHTETDMSMKRTLARKMNRDRLALIERQTACWEEK